MQFYSNRTATILVNGYISTSNSYYKQDYYKDLPAFTNTVPLF